MVEKKNIVRGCVVLVKCVTRELRVNLYTWCKGHTALKMKYQAGQRQMTAVVDVPRAKQLRRLEQAWWNQRKDEARG
jgi:hypothetical protein